MYIFLGQMYRFFRDFAMMCKERLGEEMLHARESEPNYPASQKAGVY